MSRLTKILVSLHSVMILACLWFAGAADALDMGYMPYMFLTCAGLCILESIRLLRDKDLNRG